MEETLRANDTLARLGGDEFVALLEEVNSRAVAEKVAKKLKAALSRAIVVHVGNGDEAIVQVSASAGVAIFPEDAADRLDLLRWADQAMYQDKRMRAGAVSSFSE
jgi:diguanylate cyclase (GGDEF)-like protein